MVAQADLPRIMQLTGEWDQTERAIRILTNPGGLISSLNVWGPDPNWQPPPNAPPNMPNMGLSASVNTRYMQHPAQMLQAIAQQMKEELVRIEQELAQLGVTGLTPVDQFTQRFGPGPMPPPGAPLPGTPIRGPRRVS
jgi:hypothetical protein